MPRFTKKSRKKWSFFFNARRLCGNDSYRDERRSLKPKIPARVRLNASSQEPFRISHHMWPGCLGLDTQNTRAELSVRTHQSMAQRQLLKGNNIVCSPRHKYAFDISIKTSFAQSGKVSRRLSFEIVRARGQTCVRKHAHERPEVHEITLVCCLRQPPWRSLVSLGYSTSPISPATRILQDRCLRQDFWATWIPHLWALDQSEPSEVPHERQVPVSTKSHEK